MRPRNLPALDRQRAASMAAAAAGDRGDVTDVWGSPAALYAYIRRFLRPAFQKRGGELLDPYVSINGPMVFGGYFTGGPNAAENAAVLARAVDSRRATIGAVVAAWGDRRAGKEAARAAGADEASPTVNPLVALQAARGGGKSAILGMLAALSSTAAWTPELCPDDILRATLNASMPIYVTYHDGQRPEPGSLDADMEDGLALRILYAFFVNKNVYALSNYCLMDFYRHFAHREGANVKAAIDCCLYAAAAECGDAPPRTSVLLVVDEVTRAYRTKRDEEQECNLLDVIGRLLDGYSSSRLNVVVTTLDPTYTNNEAAAGTGRRVVYAPLPRLTQEAAEAMVLAAWHKQLRDAAADDSGSGGGGGGGAAAGATSVSSPHLPSALPYFMRVAISDACGHLGTLRHVMEACLSRRLAVVAACRDAATWAAQKEALKEVRRVVRKEIDDGAIYLCPTSAAAALTGAVLPLDTLMEVSCDSDYCHRSTGTTNNHVPLRELLADSMYVNVLPDPAAASMVPHVTLYQLARFAEGTWAYAPSGNIIVSNVQQLLGAGLDPTNRAAFGDFVAAWVRAWLAAQLGKATTLARMWQQPKDDAVRVTAASSPLDATLTAKCTATWYGECVGRPTLLAINSLRTRRADSPGCDVVVALRTDADKRAIIMVLEAHAVEGGDAGHLEPVSAVAGTLALLDGGDHKARILATAAAAAATAARYAAAAKAPSEYDFVHVHAAVNGRLAAPAGRHLPPDATREQLREYMGKAAPGEPLVPLSAAAAADFAATLRRWEYTVVLDGAAWDAVLTPSLAPRAQFVLQVQATADAAAAAAAAAAAVAEGAT